MNRNQADGKVENRLSGIIVDTCFKVHTQLGPGLLELVYEEILYYELKKRNLNIQRQKAIPVTRNVTEEINFLAIDCMLDKPSDFH